MLGKMKRILIGKPMKSAELDGEKLGKWKALAILSSDALSSVAYGTEQILLVLVAAGFAALWYSIPISIAVLGLLVILIFPIARRYLLIQQGRRLYRSQG